MIFIIAGITAALVKNNHISTLLFSFFFYLTTERKFSPLNGKLLRLYFPIIISIFCWFFYCKYSVKR